MLPATQPHTTHQQRLRPVGLLGLQKLGFAPSLVLFAAQLKSKEQSEANPDIQHIKTVRVPPCNALASNLKSKWHTRRTGRPGYKTKRSYRYCLNVSLKTKSNEAGLRFQRAEMLRKDKTSKNNMEQPYSNGNSNTSNTAATNFNLSTSATHNANSPVILRPAALAPEASAAVGCSLSLWWL